MPYNKASISNKSAIVQKRTTNSTIHSSSSSRFAQKPGSGRELLNLSNRFDFPKEKWKELCELISMKLSSSSQVSFLATDQQLVDLSEKLVQKILAKKSTGVEPAGQTVTIWKNLLNVSNLRSIGGEHLCYEMIKIMDFENFKDTFLAYLYIVATVCKAVSNFPFAICIHPEKKCTSPNTISPDSSFLFPVSRFVS